MNGALRRAIFRAEEGVDEWCEFIDPVETLVARKLDEVPKLLERVEQAAAQGLWSAGYVQYEAASAFDAALETRRDSTGASSSTEHGKESEALAAFSFFPSPQPLSRPRVEHQPAGLENLTPSLNAVQHAEALSAIHEAIAAGETYQVNFTFPARGVLSGEPESLFWPIATASRAPYAAFLELEEQAILSLSPELFFALDGERIVMRPMKGTRRRGRFGAEDEALARELGESAKDRAENLMIVDMARNDLGRIARPGTVHVANLFELERYPTVWQMTSTVNAQTDGPLAEIFGALFPCASVTGAPKASAMRRIARLEKEPRGVYCGAIGWVAPVTAANPKRRARFSVPIRTATVESATNELVLGIGSGIVWDSDPAAEYDECLAKAQSFEQHGEPIALIETMLWTPRSGIRFLNRHFKRLQESAEYFDLPFNEREMRRAIEETLASLPPSPHRIRLQLDADGSSSLTSNLFLAERRSWRTILADEPVSSHSPLLFHKTSRRDLYDRAAKMAKEAGADEAILWNERGEITEGTRTNLALRIDGRWLTPARDCGLLAGVMRGYLLERRWLCEARLTKADLERAERVVLFSALRGGLRVERF